MAAARQQPTARAAARPDVTSPQPSVLDSVGDLINHGLGNMVGGLAEKAILGGRQGSGTYTATQTGARQKAIYKNSTKGLAADREY